MDLKHLTDKTLLEDTKALVKEERVLVHKLLEHLKEIEKRRLFSSLGFTSLFDYAVRGLGYSEGQAHIRISSMRLTKDIPELNRKIEEGALSLTNVAMAASFFNQHKKQSGASLKLEEKKEVLSQLENKSKRDAEKILIQRAPEILQIIETRKSVSSTLTELKVYVDDETLTLIQDLKGHLVHKHGSLTTGQLLKLLCRTNLCNGPNENLRAQRQKSKKIQMILGDASPHCQSCGSKYAIEIDHKVPKALGGSNEPANLRVLCRNCNQRAAVEKLGMGVTRHWS